MTLPESLGALFREARTAQGLSLEALARALHVPVHLLEAIEADDWEALPPGCERPLARQIADRLGLALEAHPELWERVPGPPEPEPPAPHQERLERFLGLGLALACCALGLWLILPRRHLQGQPLRSSGPTFTSEPPDPWTPPPAEGPYPVLGELLPEPPLNEAGILVTLRAVDAAQAIIRREGESQTLSLSTGTPWKGRVKGPFTLSLDNAGVVTLEVAGRRIPHGRGVGDTWEGSFDAQGVWIRPLAPPLPPPTAPETPEPPHEDEP